MSQLKQVLLIARYESKMLLRSWPFRIIVFLSFLVAAGQVGATLSLIWIVSADAYLGPLLNATNTTFLVMTSTGGLLLWAIPFFANDLGPRDGRLGVADVVGSRPLSEGAYVFGRIVGLLIPMIFVLAAAVVVSLVLNRIIGFPTATFRQFVPFFLSFNVLSMAFTVSFTAFLSILIKNRLLTSLAAMAAIVTSGLWLVNISDIFDSSGFRVAEFYSNLVGFGPITELVMHRTTYLLLTMFFISAVIFLYPRAEAARRSRLATGSLALFSITSIAFVYMVVASAARTEARHIAWGDTLREANVSRAAGVSHYGMDVHLLPRDGEISASVELSLVNRGDTNEDTFVFVLNPGLMIDSLTVADDPGVSFERNGPVVSLTLSSALPPGGVVESVWQYGGQIDPYAAWLAEPPEQDWWQRAQGTDQFLGGLSGWIGRRYSFLLPESHWYPIPNSTFGHTYPDKRPVNFATAEIRLHMPEDWTGVTQGELYEEKQSDDETVLLFKAETPVPQFSLCAGEYIKVSTEVEGIELSFLYASSHGKNVDFFSDAAQEIERAIGESFENIEDTLGLKYPYRSLSLVEVPSVCRPYNDTWDGRNLYVQPGVLLINESDFFNTYFEQSYKRSQSRTKSQGTGATDAQIKSALLKRYFSRNVFGGDLELNLIPNYWEFQIDAQGDAFPMLESALTAAFSERALGRHQMDYFYALAKVTAPKAEVQMGDDGQEATIGGDGTPFGGPNPEELRLDRDALVQPMNAMNPTDTGRKFLRLMNWKTAGLLETLSLGMGEDAWKSFMPTLLEAYRYKPITLADVEREVAAHVDKDLSWVFTQFVTEPVMPGYAIAQAEAYEIESETNDRLFQTVVRIDNLEEGNGYTKLVFEIKKAGEVETVEKNLYLASREAKEIRMVLRDRPAAVRLVSPYARNVHEPFKLLQVPEERRDEAGEDSVRTVEAVAIEEAIIVDDVDSGFTTVKLDDNGEVPATDDDVEYAEFRGIWPPKKWQEEETEGAYGSYVHTRKIKRKGNGNQVAIWGAELPEAGTYEVFFYVSQSESGSVPITVDNGVTTREIELDLKDASTGWNSLGKYDFEVGAQSRVMLSDEMRGGERGARIYADAVKWVYEEASDAVQ